MVSWAILIIIRLLKLLLISTFRLQVNFYYYVHTVLIFTTMPGKGKKIFILLNDDQVSNGR